MSNWRDEIVKRFVPKVARVTAISDPDGLLRDPGVGRAIEAKGFSIVQFEDSVAFRFDYESRFRSKWDAGEEAELVVVFKPEEYEFETLPADVLATAHRLSFALKDIFPKLSYAVISQLESVYFDALYRAHQQYASQPQDEVQTRGFVLRHVFGIEPSVIKSLPDLLRMLCQRHYNKVSIPATLDDHLVAALGRNDDFRNWPIDTLVRNRAAFWEFLDERWPIFVRQSHGETHLIHEAPAALKYAGDELLPFGHDDVRVYIDNLFEDGLLTPVSLDWSKAIDRTWTRIGLLGDRNENIDLRFNELGEHILKTCPDTSAAPRDWLVYACRYAQANHLWTQLSPSSRARYRHQFPELRGFVNQQFLAWLTIHYGGMWNNPASSPLMVHHIPGFIAHQLANKQCQRAAFILVDGLAIDQWLILKEGMKVQGITAPIEENALFAWIPTVTPISRQAAFGGKIPRYFADTLLRTDRDEARWRQFWADRGFAPAEIGFTASTGDHSDPSELSQALTPQTRALGITLYKVDKIMHGIQLGRLGMAGQVYTWCEGGFLAKLLRRLKELGFDVFISADHGNTEGIGLGKPQEGALSENRGERCRVYSDPVFQKSCRTAFPDVVAFDHGGLPENISTLLAPYGKAFTQEGATIVCHGGASLEEVCVPFIRIPAHT